MRKFILLITVLLGITFNTNAQENTSLTQHLKFMGISVDGPINKFQQKLEIRGFTLMENQESNCKLYNGTFFNEKAMILAYYTPETKFVYRAKACIVKEDEDKIIYLYYRIKEELHKKYNNDFLEISSLEGFEACRIYVTQPGNPDKYLGRIALYITKVNNVYSTSYLLHVDYYDLINETENHKSNINDL